MLLRPQALFLLSCTAFWLILCGAGLWLLAGYENTPDQLVKGPARWPEQTGLTRARAAYTLVVALHPQCPCSRATLSELAVATTHCPDLQTDLLFIKPGGMSEDWVKADLWRSAGRLKNCTRIIDQNGSLSKTFGARNSGQANLYDPNGRLVYSGGLTGSRGHEGDNPGLTGVIAIVNHGITSAKFYSVFGCPLFKSSSSER